MTVSTRNLLASGTLKRADALKIRYPDLNVKPGFNVRDENDDFRESVELLADHIYGGGDYPPLLVRFDSEGKGWIVDGHRRHAALAIAIERGAPIEWIEIRKFEGNDVDALAATVTSAEGRALTPLEMAGAFKRLAAFGLTSSEIGRKVGKTAARVEQLLLLANANHDVHEAVKAGDVSASVASEIVRKHGDKAGEVLAVEKEKATAAGKKKVTAGTIKKGAAKPAKADNDNDELGQAVRALFSSMTDRERAVLADIPADSQLSATIMIGSRGLIRLFEAAGVDYRTLPMFEDEPAEAAE